MLTTAEVIKLCEDAGFKGENLVTAVAIAHAESGLDPACTGDVTLEDETWGASVGLFQIRSLKSEFGTGAVRDEKANYDPATNVHHAFEISGGSNFSPWSTFENGAYKAFVPEVENSLHGDTPTTVIKEGDTGAIVSQLQTALNKHGASLTVDGVFGAKTLEAVKLFQHESGIEEDGIVGAETEKFLSEPAKPTPRPESVEEFVEVSQEFPTLWAIATKYCGGGNNWRELLPLNPGILPGHLVMGQKVRVK